MHSERVGKNMRMRANYMVNTLSMTWETAESFRAEYIEAVVVTLALIGDGVTVRYSAVGFGLRVP